MGTGIDPKVDYAFKRQFGIPDAAKELERIAQNTQDHNRYLSRRMYQLDQEALIRNAEHRGRTVGREEGN